MRISSRPSLLFLSFLCSTVMIPQVAFADFVIHTFGGDPDKFVEVSDDGGDTENWDIQMNGLELISQSNFAIWDDTNGVFYEGGQDKDFAGTGSGIVLFDPATGLGDVTEATGRSTAPFLPVTYSGGSYTVEQFTFAEDTGQFVIIQLTITNNSASARRTKLMFANDWDMADIDNIGFENDLNMVWQQATDTPWTTGGSALIDGNFADYRLGNCCDMTNPREDDLAEDFVTGSSSGDQVTQSDREVASLADLGTLAAGQSACTVWVYGQVNGADSADGVQNHEV